MAKNDASKKLDLRKLAVLAALATVVGSATGQTSPTYTSETKINNLIFSSGGVSYPNAAVVTQVSDLSTIPGDLLTYLNGVNPQVWGFSTNFLGTNEYYTILNPSNYVAGNLYTDNFLGQGAGACMSLASNVQSITVSCWLRFQGRFTPSYIVPRPPQPFPGTIDGKNMWVLVVRRNANGTYQIITSSNSPYAPSYYGLVANGEDDSCSNNGMGAMLNPAAGPYGGTTSNYTKLLNFHETFDLTLANNMAQYYMLEGFWSSTDNVHFGVTIRDAQILRAQLQPSGAHSLPPLPVYPQLP